MREELGLGVDLHYVYQFQYQASYGAAGSEHELCSVYVGQTDDEVRPNATEIDAIRFLSADELEQEMAATPERFTPWFKQEWDCLRREHVDALAPYLRAA